MKKEIGLIGVMAMTLLAADRTAYIGTYTKPQGSKGIYMVRFDEATGKLSTPELAGESESPSFLTLSKNGKFLYAVNEINNGDVSAFAIEANGKLRFLNKAKSKGDAPCHLNLDATGKWIAVANYTSGTASILPVGADGKVGEAVATVQHTGKGSNPRRQSSPHAHSVNFSKDNTLLYIADLGLDQVKVYSFDAKTGKIAETAQLVTPSGAGPRHLALSSTGKAYVINEMASSVSVFNTATHQLIETVSALPADYKGDTSGAEIVLHPKGTLLFSSNRGHDSISIYRVNPSNGTIKLLGQQPVGGKVPRGFVLTPDGNFLIAGAQNSDKVFAFKVDLAAGKLIPSGDAVSVGMPVCIRFVK
ncbi:lactonase family protein [Bryobacter aggregatus]|uniref:lactonase family protein n=1 Tax=Bryobacter aggregatus TaxID=360054 RepID=UPI0004E193DF|nr:lactonase family protein [Bryobacter aggregatus]